MATKLDGRVKEIMIKCQTGAHSNHSLIVEMSKLYNTMDNDTFKNSFMFCLRKFLIVYTKEPSVERGLDFISKFSASLKVKPEVEKSQKSGVSSDEDEEEDEMHPFLHDLFFFLIQNHDVISKAVRYRSCQLINKLLCDLGEDAQIDSALFDRIYDVMLVRVRDHVPMVKIQAIYALKRLQEPQSQDCPVIEAYLSLLANDTSADVRRAVLSSVAVTIKTLPLILDRTRDVSDLIRKLTFKVVAEKVHIKAISIAQRVALIKRGLNDRSDVVKDACINLLIKSWLRVLDNNIFKLLDCLDCRNYHAECCSLLEAIFRKGDPSTLVAEFDILDEKKLIPYEKLNMENSVYWSCLCKHLQSLGAEKDELLERLLPSCIPFVEYVKDFQSRMKMLNSTFDASEINFILEQIVIVMGVLDLSDEAGRRAVLELIHKMLLDESTANEVVGHLMSLFLRLYPDNDACLAKVAELISDIKHPAFSEVNEKAEEEKRRQVNIKVAEIQVEILHLKDVLEDSVTRQDFTKAAEIKETMKELEMKKKELEAEKFAEENEEADVEGVPRSQAKNDPQTLARCLMIVAEVLSEVRFNKLVPCLLSIMDFLIIPSIVNKDGEVRNLSFKCLGLCCLRSSEKTCQYMFLFFQASRMDCEAVKVTALKVIFNLLLMYGMPFCNPDAKGDSVSRPQSKAASTVADDDDLDMFGGDGEAAEKSRGGNGNGGQEDKRDVAVMILEMLTENLDNESLDIRTVCAEGLAKLLLSSSINSSSLLSRLILLWYNPITEDDVKLRHCLGTFFPIFAFSSRTNQEMVAEAFLPTLKALMAAPPSSPLFQIKPSNVAELMVHLSNTRHQRQKLEHSTKDTGESGSVLVDKCPHDDVAEALSNEILSDPDDFDGIKVYAKALVMLELTPTNPDLLKSLQILVEKMLQDVRERECRKLLTKFSESIEEMLDKLRKVDQNASLLDDTLVVDGDENGTSQQPSEVVSSEVISIETNSKDAIQEPTSTTSSRSTKSATKRKQPQTVEKPHSKLEGLSINFDKKISLTNNDSGDSSDAFKSPPRKKGPTRKARESVTSKCPYSLKRKRNIDEIGDEDGDVEEEDSDDNDDDDIVIEEFSDDDFED